MKMRGGLTVVGGVAGLLAVMPIAVSQAQMSLPGSFDVSDTGAASYTIPIVVPPGTAGMQPSLSLAYNSQGGNGLMGMGWSLSGLPTVTRCPKTIAQDGVVGGINYDANDRFCLEGQRLVVISGAYGFDQTEYRTEQESFSKIDSYGTAGTGPAWFKVWTKSGQVMEFGNTTDSRIEAQGKSTARLWSVNKISDTKGNYLTVTYAEDNANGEYRPTRIDYTGNSGAGISPFASVQFIYETRPDFSLLHEAGSLIKTTQRLTGIKTILGETLVYSYRLIYSTSPSTQRSRPASITLCDTDLTCLPATVFSWQTGNGDVGTFSAQSSGFPNGGSFPVSGAIAIGGDFNGDGRNDFTLITNTHYHPFLSNGDGTFTSLASVTFPNGGSFPASGTIPIGGDFDGDGRTDFILITNTNYHPFLSNGDGTFTSLASVMFPNGGSFPASGTIPIAGDFNSDGRTDFILLTNTNYHPFMSNGDGTVTSLAYASVPNGTSFPASGTIPIIGDFNGDGRTDFTLVTNTNYYPFLGNGGTSDAIGSIQSGVGTVISLTHKPLTDGLTYTKGAGAIFPTVELQAPLYVISEVQSSDGIGGNYRSTYKYAGARSHVQGRGFLGFETVTAKDEQTLVEQVTTYLQPYPYTGLVASRVKKLGATTLNETVNSYAQTSLGGTRSFVYLTQSVEKSWELNGSLVSQVTTTHQYDAFGDATQVAVTTPDGYSKTTTNTYQNDTLNWLLGRLTRASVTSVTPN